MISSLHFGSCVLVVAFAVLADGNVARSQPPKPKDGPLGMKFVPLSKGTTYLGWDGTKGSTKKMEIKEDFEIAVYTVTQGQWQQLMGNNPSWFSREARGDEELKRLNQLHVYLKLAGKVKDIKDEELKQFPVENVSWDDCQEFINKLNEKEKGRGYVYRLPTSAEWEYACRGGATTEEECSYHFYFEKPTNDLSSKQANFDGRFPFGKGQEGPYLGRPTKVGSYAPNKLGLYDMHGNVWQWTDSMAQLGRVVRGHCWYNGASGCQARIWVGGAPETRSGLFGFRLVRVPVR